MNDVEIPPDPIVRTALELLPIAEHGADFWAGLARRLDAVELEARVVDPAPPVFRPPPRRPSDPAPPLVPPSMRRRSNAVLGAVAVAAVVVVALAAGALLETRDGSPVTAADRTEASAELDALVEAARPEEAVPSTLSAQATSAASGAVLGWMDSMAAADSERAWAALGSSSQARFASRSAFEEELPTLAAEQAGWAGTDPADVLVTPLATVGDDTLAVVTLTRTAEVDGRREDRVTALAVRIAGADVYVEPWAFSDPDQLEVVVPAGADDLGAGDALVVVVPDDAEPPVVRLDDGEALICGVAEDAELVALDGLPGRRCSYLPAAGIEAGAHTLTVAFWTADGASVVARAVTFSVA